MSSSAQCPLYSDRIWSQYFPAMTLVVFHANSERNKMILLLHSGRNYCHLELTLKAKVGGPVAR